MIIRKAKLTDINAIVNLWEEFMKDHDKIILKINPKVKIYIDRKSSAKLCFKKFAVKQIKSKNGLLLIAEVDKKPAGYCLSLIKTDIPIYKINKLGYISDLFVKKQFRGMNISSKFKDLSFEWFKKRKIKQASIVVYYWNKQSLGIYKKWGFFERQLELRKKL